MCCTHLNMMSKTDPMVFMFHKTVLLIPQEVLQHFHMWNLSQGNIHNVH